MVVTDSFLYLISKVTKVSIIKAIPLGFIEEFVISTSYKFGAAFKLKTSNFIGYSHIILEH